VENQEKQGADDWMCGGWDEAAESRRELTRSMSFRERMLWLERMTKFARRLEESPIVAPPDEDRIRAAERKQGEYGLGGGEPGGEGGR